MLGALREIRDRVGYKKFPLNEITYYSSSNTMIIAPEMPAVLKLSHAHAGQGKIKVESQTAFEDMRTVCSLHNEYLSADPFFAYTAGYQDRTIQYTICLYFNFFSIRVQYCCGTYRTWRKIPTGSGWKSQFGGSVSVFLVFFFFFWYHSRL
jgi:hypothetical protein